MLPSGKFTSSVFSKRKEAKDYSPEDFARFLENYKLNNISIPKLDKSNGKDHVDVEISISDYHLAKRTVDGDNDSSNRALRYYEVAQTLINKVEANYNIDTVVFPISNDFFTLITINTKPQMVLHRIP